MVSMSAKRRLLVADPVSHTRMLVVDVLRNAGFSDIVHARDGQSLLTATEEYEPKIVITTSRLPGKISGLDFTRRVRAGYRTVQRTLPIIVMTETPTVAFLEAARASGVDEMLVRPFSAQAVLARIQAVTDNPRQFIDSAVYVGPCRRRRMLDNYSGPLRRFMDPLEDLVGTQPWELASNREVVRQCLQKISELADSLSPGDRRKLREIYTAVQEAESIADETLDQMMASAARSLGRYIMAVGASGNLDCEVVTTHLDAMHTLGLLSSIQHAERENLVGGLHRIVDKKLGRVPARARDTVSI
jgi:DNA-binding response OmpR family regulator